MDRESGERRIHVHFALRLGLPSQQAHDDDLGWNIGRYTVYGEIAAGGMATVHIGRMVGEVGFAKLVAIKRLHSHLAKDPEFLDMFLDEVRLASRIRHPNVVQPLDVVVTGGEVFLVMEYIHGDSLARILRTVRQQTLHIPMKITSAILIGALNGLHAAHEAKDERGTSLGIVHRDVSPQNIMIGVDGVSRVLDFGVAKAEDQVHSTKAGELKGKLAYMAPEQIKGKPSTRRTDIYAASIVLWEALTGHKLFDVDASSVGALMQAQIDIRPPSSINPQVTPEVDELVLKGLSINPELRYATALEMAGDLIERLPPAAQQQVGQWVETTAKAALTERGARIADIERIGADSSQKASAASVLSGKLPPVSELSASHLLEDQSSSSIKAKPPARQPSIPPVLPQRESRPVPEPSASSRPPGLSATGKSLVVPSARPTFPKSDPSGVAAAPPTISPLAGTHFPAADFGPDNEETRRPTPAHPFAPTVMQPERSGSLAPPEVPLTPAAPARITVQQMPGRKRSLIPYFWIPIAIAAIVAIVASPELLRRRIIEHAAADGIVLTTDNIELSYSNMTVQLKKVRVSSPEIPGASFNAEVIDVAMAGFEVDSITARNADLVIDGRWGPVRASFDKWATAHPDPRSFGQARKLRLDGVHVTWNGAFGAGTKMDGSGVVGELTKVAARPLGADATFTFPALTFDTPIGALGPWRFDVNREASRTTATVLLDAGAPGGPSVITTIDPDGRTIVDCKVTRAPLIKLGVPLVMVGQKPDDATKVDVAVHLDLASQTVSGTLHLGLYDVRLGGVGPTETVLDAHFSGPRGTTPVPLQEGTFALAGQPGPLAGAITIADDGVRVEGNAKVRGCPPDAVWNGVIDTRDPTKSGGGLATKSPCKLK
jgi:serine/threonine-protein kinase